MYKDKEVKFRELTGPERRALSLFLSVFPVRTRPGVTDVRKEATAPPRPGIFPPDSAATAGGDRRGLFSSGCTVCRRRRRGTPVRVAGGGGERS